MHQNSDENREPNKRPKRPVKETRRMVKTELLGKHLHETEGGKKVGVYQRNGKYLARGRLERKPFGVTLSSDEQAAERELRRLLVRIDDGTFIRPSEAHKQPLRLQTPPRLKIRELCNTFLKEKRQTCGKDTAADYLARLAPLIEFAEQNETRKHWPLAGEIDRSFANNFRKFLINRRVTRNGRANSTEKPMSAGQICNVLECTQTMLNWAQRPDVNMLPITFISPFSKEFIGKRPQKDPMRQNKIPLEARLALVAQMDAWQLSHFAIPLTLPLRPEDYTGLLISEVDFVKRLLRFGTRFDGRDFNKGKQNFSVPFPIDLEPLLRVCIGGRTAGPVLRSRSIFDESRQSQRQARTNEEIANHFEQVLASLPPDEIQTPQDTKRIFRRMLPEFGGVSCDSMGKEFNSLCLRCGLPEEIRLYDLRGSVNTELQLAGVSHLVQRYVTGHTTKDILFEYVTLESSLESDMKKYFDSIQSLLDAITERANVLGVRARSAA